LQELRIDHQAARKSGACILADDGDWVRRLRGLSGEISDHFGADIEAEAVAHQEAEIGIVGEIMVQGILLYRGITARQLI
jgi:hypothetical protein